MKPAHYRDLLGRLFEGNLSKAEAEELGLALENSAALRRDLRQHLVLWEIWSHDQSPERSATRFVHSWETRLGADGECGKEFAAAVMEKLESPDFQVQSEKRDEQERPRPVEGRRGALWREELWLLFQRHGRLLWALSGAIVVLLSAWFVTTRSTHAAPTTIQGEGICTVCTLNKGREHLQAIRVMGPTDDLHLYFLETNQISTGVYFCDGPIPVVGKGYLRTNEARVLLEATELKVQRR